MPAGRPKKIEPRSLRFWITLPPPVATELGQYALELGEHSERPFTLQDAGRLVFADWQRRRELARERRAKADAK